MGAEDLDYRALEFVGPFRRVLAPLSVELKGFGAVTTYRLDR